MAVKRKGLGRGLDALLGGALPAMTAEEGSEEMRDIPVDLIQPGKYQPRMHMHPESLQGSGGFHQGPGVGTAHRGAAYTRIPGRRSA